MSNALSKELRNLLARVTLDARETAERAAQSGLENLAVHEKEYRPHMLSGQRDLRNRLRERGRALGDARDERSSRQGIGHLTEDVAYEHWHRLLFTRFLAENGLLHTDASQGSVPITLSECDELASELGARDGFELACRFASAILPGVFRPDDPVFELALAVNDQVELRRLLYSLPSQVFIADDSLGWTYQFWQGKRKDDVNASGTKIGADELPAVTQLFTEDYMVEFLLHNTLGAWWAAKLGHVASDSEAEAREKSALAVNDGLNLSWGYLRFVQDEQKKTWRPAAGPFDAWPNAAKDIRFLDPCMGSGHFLVFALPILARLRMEQEKSSAREAVYSVLRDNIYGLELDPRCAQIAAFNVALTAWKLAGYQQLPVLHLACAGLAPHTTQKQWLAVAGRDDRLRQGMVRLHSLFENAPTLGSLINPRAVGGDLLEAEFDELQPLLQRALVEEAKDDAVHETAVVAQGIAKAAAILAAEFTLVCTNVPYLGRGKQNEILQRYCERAHPLAKGDLATCFVERSLEFCAAGATTALITPQNWLFLGTYKKLRTQLLQRHEWDWLLRLGEHGFDSPQAAGAFVVLFSMTRRVATPSHQIAGLEAADGKSASEKASRSRTVPITFVRQSAQFQNPDSRISFAAHENVKRLSDYCSSFLGLGTGDYPHFGRYFWEFSHLQKGWSFQQGSVDEMCLWGGREHVVAWDDSINRVRGMSQAEREQIHNQDQSGQQAWGNHGVVVGLMRDLKPTLYTGEPHDKAVAALIPKSRNTIPALWALCSSRDFHDLVRQLDQNVIVANGTLVKIPFDLPHWQAVAAKKYPDGLPKPVTKDATQWLFSGRPLDCDQPLHAAAARLLGYGWPRQTGSSFPDCPAIGPDGLEKLADADGILCLPSINREQSAAHRLREVLMKALVRFDERAVIAGAGRGDGKSTTLEEWLRDEFFEQHCDLFHHRPFIWHVWDGRKDGFHALVNYHRLDQATLQKLTYSYLGDWIRRQQEDAKEDKPGADARLSAARALQAILAKILEGDAPYDIFIRWKTLSKQPVGWYPDLNDGVRLNIRPFVAADILRKRVKVSWEKDRGKEVQREKSEYPWFWCQSEPDTDPEPGQKFIGNRWNNVHLTLQRKRRSRGKA